jgi:hypothetical protein
MTNEPALTVDSLHTFKYRKRFSFCNRNVEEDEPNNANNDEVLDSSKNSEVNELETSKSPKKQPSVLKGSAKLKNSDSDSEGDSKKKKKTEKK